MAEELELPGGVHVTIGLDGEATGGALMLLVDRPPVGWVRPAPAGGGPGGPLWLLGARPPVGWALPPHRHRNESETIHVVAGRFELVIEGERRELGPGDSAHVPAGTLHEGRKIGHVEGRRVIVFAPAGVEGWFRAVAAEPDRAGELAL